MSVETSSAPRETWTINFCDDGRLAGEFPIGDKQSAEDFAVEGSAFFGQACEAVRYVRRDLVVPTVDVMAALDEMALTDNTGDPHDEGYTAAVDGVRAWLLSRIEGDNDEA